MTHARRTYSPEEKRVALTYLTLYRGDVTRTSQQTGVNKRTLQRWRAELAATSATATWAEGSPSRDPATSATSHRDIDVAALNEIRADLITKARLLLLSVEEMIPQASLTERIIAATRLIDRVVRLTPTPAISNDPSPNEIITYKIVNSSGFEQNHPPAVNDPWGAFPERRFDRSQPAEASRTPTSRPGEETPPSRSG